MRRMLLVVTLLAGCTKAGTGQGTDKEEPTRTDVVPSFSSVEPSKPPAPAPQPQPQPQPPQVAQPQVVLASVTLADDCGGDAPTSAPSTRPKGAASAPKADMDDRASKSKSNTRESRRCEQTSMQLSVTVFEKTAIAVKSVELFDDTGKSLGTLRASKPRVWSVASSTYKAWDQTAAPGPESSVSYVLSQPAWNHIDDRWNRTFTLKTVITVGGKDLAQEKSVQLNLSAPTSLPPGVKT